MSGGYQLPQTQSLPDLSLSFNDHDHDHDHDRAPQDSSLPRRHDTAQVVGPPLSPESLSPPPSPPPPPPARRLDHSSRRSSTSSSRRSSISSLGSIHSAPELLQQPPPPKTTTTPPRHHPPALTTTTHTKNLARDDDDDPDHDELERAAAATTRKKKKRQSSVAVMNERTVSSSTVMPPTTTTAEFLETDDTDDNKERSDDSGKSGRDLVGAIEERDARRGGGGGGGGGGTTTTTNRTTTRRRKREFPNTLWDYLKQEVLTVEVDGEEGIKSERVTNFLTVPQELEKIIFFGFIICLDSFLYTFTILPLRSICALCTLVVSNPFSSATIDDDDDDDNQEGRRRRFWSRRRGGRRRGRRLGLSQRCDVLKMVIVVVTVFALHRVTDASKMYHGVRGQETIKLYVLFNVLEIADRLCCSFGQDLSDSLFSSMALSPSSSSRSTTKTARLLRPVSLFVLYTVYVISHSLVLFYQLVTLNVAVNSYSNALLTLLLSNQFVEIKGSVFKKFEKENLFQLTCADIVERFQLALMLFIISLRNLVELSTSIPATTPTTTTTTIANTSRFSLVSSSLPVNLVLTTFSPALTVLVSECFVDWLKHAFITKFNHIRPQVYSRYMDVLCKDLIKGQSGGSPRRTSAPLIDQSPSVSRRLGFAALPLSCLVIRVSFQAIKMLGDESALDECLLVPPSPPRFRSTPTTTTLSTLLSFDRDTIETTTTTRTASSSSLFALERVNGFESFVRTALERVTLERGQSLFKLGFDQVTKWIGVVSACLGIWICLITLKLLIGINLRTFASDRWNGLDKIEREREDYKNSRSRGGIGVSKSEAIEIEKTNELLRDKRFDEPSSKAALLGGGGKDKIELEDLGRYDMVRSRLW